MEKQRRALARSALNGALAGLAATALMSALMLAAGRLGLMGQQPPEAITERLLPWRYRLPWHEAETNALSSATHLAFGAAAGSLFGVTRRVVPLATLPGAGIVYGLLVWLTSYVGWIPALRILPPADRDRAGRQPAMIAAHVVYGMVLGLLTRGVRRGREAMG